MRRSRTALFSVHGVLKERAPRILDVEQRECWSWLLARYRSRLFLGLVGALAACSNVEPVAPANGPITDPTQLYRQLAFDHPAVTMSTVAPYDTIRLTAIPRDAMGNAMSGLPVPTYRVSDTAVVQVTADGLVTAIGPTSEVFVVASLTVPPVTHTDSARIQVTSLAATPKLATFSIKPALTDSTIIPWQPFYNSTIGSDILEIFNATSNEQVPRTVLDDNGNSISDILFDFRSLNPSVLTVTRRGGFITPQQPGEAKVVAQTTVYGVSKVDTVTYTISPPILQEIGIQPIYTGKMAFVTVELGTASTNPVVQDILIRPGGMVLWYWNLADSASAIPYKTGDVDIAFDDPTNVMAAPPAACGSIAFFLAPAGCTTAGNVSIPPWKVVSGSDINTSQMRQFPVAGVYPYHSTRLGVNGRVVVTMTPGS